MLPLPNPVSLDAILGVALERIRDGNHSRQLRALLYAAYTAAVLAYFRQRRPGLSKKKAKRSVGLSKPRNTSRKHAKRATAKLKTSKQRPQGNQLRHATTRKTQSSARQEKTVASQPTPKIALKPVDNPVHVLIRVRSDGGSTISEHYRVLQECSRALIGKVGKALGDGFMDELNDQITSGAETSLFLTTRDGWGDSYTTYQCNLEAVHKSLPTDKRDLVPTYYESEFDAIGSWFEITSMYELERSEMNRIEVVSSGRSIAGVMKSMASVFRVRVS